ncbi:hypothetical protein [Salmon gill poxvirus]|nr:hypothetical protein [Salmon gill poxvirus]
MTVQINHIFPGPVLEKNNFSNNFIFNVIGSIIMVSQIMVIIILLLKYYRPEFLLLYQQIVTGGNVSNSSLLKSFFEYIIPDSDMFTDYNRLETFNILKFITNVKQLTIRCENNKPVYTWNNVSKNFKIPIRTTCLDFVDGLKTN